MHLPDVVIETDNVFVAPRAPRATRHTVLNVWVFMTPARTFTPTIAKSMVRSTHKPPLFNLIKLYADVYKKQLKERIDVIAPLFLQRKILISLDYTSNFSSKVSPNLVLPHWPIIFLIRSCTALAKDSLSHDAIPCL
ncbi:hypothetical protein KW783_01775 [Candidatus Parcubacteria bacterium]|nr:hypothetical protein [Candidatus Parcubacteria bacterium]